MSHDKIKYRVPEFEDLYAIEREARRMRAEVTAELLRAAGRWIVSGLRRLVGTAPRPTHG